MKRKGGTARDRLKEARNEIAVRRTETGYEAALDGRAGRKSRSPYPSSPNDVNPANARGRPLDLPQEIRAVSRETILGTEDAARHPDRGAEVSRGRIRPGKRLKARTVPRQGVEGEGE